MFVSGETRNVTVYATGPLRNSVFLQPAIVPWLVKKLPVFMEADG